MSVIGSYPKFLYGSNVYPLNRHTTAQALEKLADTLHLQVSKADVTEIEFGANYLMKHPVGEYLSRLGAMPRLGRVQVTPCSIRYEGTGKRNPKPRVLAFYDKIADAFVLGLNDNFMNTPHNVSHNEVIKNDADVDDDIMYEPVIISMDKFINKNNSPNISNEHDEEDDTSIHTSHTTHKIKNPTGRGRKHMSDDMCIAFFADAEKLTIDELNAKYEGYCYCRNKTELLKKINKQRTRLVKKGVINA